MIPLLPLVSEVGRRYGAIRCALERSGRLIGNNDLWIAAHALALGVPVITNNDREFTRVPGLQVLNWAKKPNPHPEEILRELCLEPLGLSVTRTAYALGVSRKTLSSILDGRSGISAEMAIRLSIAFDTTAESWLRQQLHYDLAKAEAKRRSLRVKTLAAA